MNHLNSINHLNEKFYNLNIFFCFPHNHDIYCFVNFYIVIYFFYFLFYLIKDGTPIPNPHFQIYF